MQDEQTTTKARENLTHMSDDTLQVHFSLTETELFQLFPQLKWISEALAATGRKVGVENAVNVTFEFEPDEGDEIAGWLTDDDDDDDVYDVYANYRHNAEAPAPDIDDDGFTDEIPF